MSFSGPQALSSESIQAWNALSQFQMRPREFKVIRMMDRARLRAFKDAKVQPGLHNLVDMRDGKGMLNLLRSIGSKVQAK